MAKSSDEISGVQKAAILLIALGPEKSSNVFSYFAFFTALILQITAQKAQNSIDTIKTVNIFLKIIFKSFSSVCIPLSCAQKR